MDVPSITDMGTLCAPVRVEVGCEEVNREPGGRVGHGPGDEGGGGGGYRHGDGQAATGKVVEEEEEEDKEEEEDDNEAVS
jgi:hypothetical protein